MQLSIAFVMCLCAAAGLAQDRSYEKINSATLNEGRKTIDADFGGHGDTGAQNAKLAAMRDSVNLMLKEHGERMSAMARGNQATAGRNGEAVQAAKTGDKSFVAKDAEGKAAQASQVSDSNVQATDADGQKAAASAANGRAMSIQGRQRAMAALNQQDKVVRGGTAQQGANSAVMTNGMQNGQKTSQLEANRRFNANAAAVQRNQFNVMTNDKQNADSRGQYAAKSLALAEEAGNGMVNARNKQGQAAYNYAFSQDGQNEGQVSLDQAGAGSGVFSRRTTGWNCKAIKDGESTCFDADGKTVGKVMTNSKGEATIIDNAGVVAGRGHVQKLNDEQYQVTVSDGVALARTEQLKEFDCYSEIVPGGSQEHKIAIKNVRALVNGEPIDAEGGQTVSWPTCFDIEADVTIPEGVDPSRLAFEYVGHVMPMGSLKCQDSLTCGRECYYCNACVKETLLGENARLTTGNAQNSICDIHGGAGTQKVSMRVCPPEEVEKTAFCGGFSRHLVGNDYYKYDGSINAQIRVWLRPENLDTVRSKYFEQVKIPLVKQGLVNAYKIEKGTLNAPENNELLQWYVRKNSEEQLMACRKGVVDYQVGGDKVDSNIMIDAFANAPNGAKNVQLFSDSPCEEYKAHQKIEYEHFLKEHQSAQGTNTNSVTNSLSSLLSKFSRGRRL